MKRLFIAFSLLITLLCISTETEAQTQRTRTYLHGRFETGDYPTQTDYRDVFATFFSRLEDSLSISVLYGVDTISNDVTLADSSTVALVTEAAVKGYVDAAAGSVTNGDKGDITVTSGTSWTIDNDVVDADAIATGAVGTSEIANNSVANADLATMATNTLKGNDSGGSATPQDLTTAEVKTMLAIGSTDVTDFEEAVEDLVGANIIAGSGVSVSYDDGTGNTTISSSSLADGDKGDIDVTGSGTTWTIDTSAVVWDYLAQEVKDSISLGAGQQKQITQASHGFRVGQPVTKVAGTWVGAETTTPVAAQAIVIDSTSANSFKIAFRGIFDVSSHGFLVDTTYYTPVSAGLPNTFGNRPEDTQGLFTPISSGQLYIHIGDLFLNQNPPSGTVTTVSDTSGFSRGEYYDEVFNYSPAYYDSLTLVNADGGSTFSSGAVGTGATITQETNSGDFTIGTYYWKFAAGDGDITNAIFTARLPTAYEGDTTKEFRVRLAYKFTDNDVAHARTIEVWERRAAGSYVINGTDLATVGDGSETYVEIIRKISDPDTRFIVVVLRVDGDVTPANRDTILIGDIQVSLLLPDEKVTQFATVTTPDYTPETIDTTVANFYTLAKYGTRDFSTLEEAIDGISAGSNGAWNQLYIKNGVYNFLQNHLDSSEYLPAFLRITGQSRDSVIIVADGNTEPGLETSESAFNPKESSIIENLTIYATDVKYCLHPDFNGNAVSWWQNLRLVKEGSTENCVGIGQRDNEWFHLLNVDMETRNNSISDGYAIFWHNASSQDSPTTFKVEGCKANGMGLIHISDIQSAQPDKVIVKNSSASGHNAGIKAVTSYSDSTTTLQLIQENVNVNFYDYTDLYTDTIFLNTNDYVVRVYNNSGGTLTKGSPVVIDYVNSTNTRQYVDSPGSDGWFDYVVYSDIGNAAYGWAVKKGKTAYVTNVNASYTKGDLLKVNASGIFETTVTRSEATAVSLETTTTSTSLLKVRLL